MEPKVKVENDVPALEPIDEMEVPDEEPAGWTYPGSRYIGPNSRNDGPPTSQADDIARLHDGQYNLINRMQELGYPLEQVLARMRLADQDAKSKTHWWKDQKWFSGIALKLGMSAKMLLEDLRVISGDRYLSKRRRGGGYIYFNGDGPPSSEMDYDVSPFASALSRFQRPLSEPRFYRSGKQTFFSRSWTGDSKMYKRQKRVYAPVSESSTVNFQAATRRQTLSGREYISTLSASQSLGGASPYASESHLLRPTDYHVFSWLAGISKKYEEFKFHRLVLVYEPQCPTTTAGSVCLWFDGDPTHSAPANWNNCINMGANTHGAPWAHHKLVVPPHLFSGRKSYYTRDEFIDANAGPNALGLSVSDVDPVEYFPGIYGWSSVDATDGTGTAKTLNLGKIYLDYSVSFKVQNVDGYAKTNSANLQVSSELADNSGTGYVVVGNLVGSISNTAPSFIFGATSGSHFDDYGGQLFSYNTSTGVATAVQDVELCVDVCLVMASKAVTNVVFTVIRKGVAYGMNIANGTSSYSQDAGADATLAPKMMYHSYSVPSAFASTSISSKSYLALQQGDQLEIGVQCATAADNLNNWRLYMTPCVFKIKS